ncbi:coagulase domain-containing protein [Staphylococcus hyicus]
MKKKLLVLSASAILASNFIFDNSASAVVDVRENPYKSEALQLGGRISYPSQVDVYLKSLDELIYYKSVNKHAGYDEPEYKKAYDKYQKKYLAEMEALKQFKIEQKEIEKNNDYHWSSGKKGLTYERYESIYKKILELRAEFDKEAESIESKNKELKRFNKEKQYEVGYKINVLENQILMIGKAFIHKHTDEVLDMYNHLDMVIGTDGYERYDMRPTNERMFKIKIEDLESIIDKFFFDINASRPLTIDPLTKLNENDVKAHKKLREDVKRATENPNLRHARAKAPKETQKNMKNLIKKEQKFKHKVLKQSRETKNISKNANLNNQPNHGNIVNSISGNSHNKKPASIGGESKPVNIIQDSKAPSQYGSNGQLIEFSENTLSNSTGSVKQQPTFTEDTKPTKKEVITESHAVDLDEKTTHYMSGYATGYSVEDTSGYTERDKRAIRRNHVREAEELVNKYVNSHAYQDRVAAQAKVKTLSPEQQKRLNQQIDKIYNGQ